MITNQRAVWKNSLVSRIFPAGSTAIPRGFSCRAPRGTPRSCLRFDCKQTMGDKQALTDMRQRQGHRRTHRGRMERQDRGCLAQVRVNVRRHPLIQPMMASIGLPWSMSSRLRPGISSWRESRPSAEDRGVDVGHVVPVFDGTRQQASFLRAVSPNPPVSTVSLGAVESMRFRPFGK